MNIVHAIRNMSGDPESMWRRNPPFHLTVVGSAAAALFQGCGLLFGPAAWRSSPGYHALRDQMPMRAWGAVFIAVALVLGYGILRDWRAVRIGAALALIVVTIWLLSFVIAAFNGDLQGVPAPWIAWAVFLWVQTQGPHGGFDSLQHPDGTG